MYPEKLSMIPKQKIEFCHVEFNLDEEKLDVIRFVPYRWKYFWYIIIWGEFVSGMEESHSSKRENKRYAEIRSKLSIFFIRNSI